MQPIWISSSFLLFSPPSTEKQDLLQQTFMTELALSEKSSSELPSLSAAQIDPTSSVIVNFIDSQDPYNPINWPFPKKLVTSGLYSLTSLGSV